MVELEKAFWTLVAAMISLSAGQFAFTRSRNIRIESRITTLEATQLTEAQVQAMIDKSQQPMVQVLERFETQLDEHRDLMNRLSGLIGELNVKTAVLEEKMRND